MYFFINLEYDTTFFKRCWRGFILYLCPKFIDGIMEAMVFEQKVSKLPFEAQREVSDYIDSLLYKYNLRESAKPYAGCMKGTVTWMSDDFNAPLDDFKDYM